MWLRAVRVEEDVHPPRVHRLGAVYGLAVPCHGGSVAIGQFEPVQHTYSCQWASSVPDKDAVWAAKVHCTGRHGEQWVMAKDVVIVEIFV